MSVPTKKTALHGKNMSVREPKIAVSGTQNSQNCLVGVPTGTQNNQNCLVGVPTGTQNSQNCLVGVPTGTQNKNSGSGNKGIGKFSQGERGKGIGERPYPVTHGSFFGKPGFFHRFSQRSTEIDYLYLNKTSRKQSVNLRVPLGTRKNTPLLRVEVSSKNPLTRGSMKIFGNIFSARKVFGGFVTFCYKRREGFFQQSHHPFF